MSLNDDGISKMEAELLPFNSIFSLRFYQAVREARQLRSFISTGFSCRNSRTPSLQVLFNTNNGKRETNRTISLQGSSLICPVFLLLREVKSVSGFRSVISLVSATLYVVFKCLVVAAFSWISWRRSKKSGNNPD